MSQIPKPVCLIILDGFGIAPRSEGNAVEQARTPNFNKYLDSYPAMSLMASGEAVGLSWGEMGNSEVGHLNLGVGRIFYQNLPRIDKTIETEEFYQNAVLVDAINHAKRNNSKLHIMGIIGEGKVHGSSSHCFALLELAKREKFKDVYVHVFLDGRDSSKDGGREFVEELEKQIKKHKVGKIASLHGRMYAMDRNNQWDRIEKSYKVMVEGVSEEYYSDPIKAIKESYKKNVYDEEFVPTVIGDKEKPVAKVSSGDSVIFFNYRADRARELTKAFVLDEFDKFNRSVKLDNLYFSTMTEYEDGLPVKVVFEKEEVKSSLPKYLSEKGYKQLHMAETEKYAHVTFFFSGGVEQSFEGEDRIVVPSPKLASYSEKPEMSARLVTEKLTKEILSEKHDFIVVNYANPDMVGHTGNIEATVKSVETVDKALGQVVELILSKGGVALIVADHGNAEEMLNLQTGELDKEHSTNPVPFIVVGKEFEGKTVEDVELVNNDLSLIQPTGLLSDVPVTVLKLMNLDPPEDMTGRSLI
ncbi:2,3-bisphosphoglycerate-independent phosphoglycerate mutase [Candidatus Falkowbacteria bacterium]|jgi:2,3-bisphosphoglycerate-independent phosphoglycerate mutase|nr:2,3-bisphosphoglycerate-independent phosphoglycerate mutase [Candidatus Falkowbacteria bacterium]MBT7007192.1 2,3-bisphosphoglycerate-independent phosphoglycerate mutase [Candidatus Falkowbacteria bacterium]